LIASIKEGTHSTRQSVMKHTAALLTQGSQPNVQLPGDALVKSSSIGDLVNRSNVAPLPAAIKNPVVIPLETTRNSAQHVATDNCFLFSRTPMTARRNNRGYVETMEGFKAPMLRFSTLNLQFSGPHSSMTIMKQLRTSTGRLKDVRNH